MDWEAIWKRARSEFLPAKSLGDLGLLLWEHSIRVARTASKILTIDEVRAANPDEVAVVSAALYHHSGWITRAQNEENLSDAALLAPLSEADRDLGAELLARSLGRFLPDKTLSRAAQAVVDAGDRKTESIDAMVVAEADALDEFGLPSLWLTIRRGSLEGRGTLAAIETWQRQVEYRFWEARLKDAFRFAAVRAVARARLDRFALLMQHLAEEHSGADVDCQLLQDVASPSGPSHSEVTDAALSALK